MGIKREWKDKLAELIKLSREIVDLKYCGLELVEEAAEKLEEYEDRFRYLRTELETIKSFETDIDEAVMYIRRARTRFIIGEI